jgi:hypothetical protein
MDTCSRFIDSLGYWKTRRFGCWPQGGYNKELLGVIPSFWDFGRNIIYNMGGNPPTILQPYEIITHYGYSGQDSVVSKKWIDTISAHHQFGIATFHAYDTTLVPFINRLKYHRDIANDLNVTTWHDYMTYSPDSIINLRKATYHDSSLTIIDSLSFVMDTGRVILYDSTTTWDSVAGTDWKIGGQICTLLTSNTHKITKDSILRLRQIVLNKNGTYDSTASAFNIKTGIFTMVSLYDTVSPGVGVHSWQLDDTITLSFKPKANCVFIKWQGTNNATIADQFNPITTAIIKGDATIAAI